MRELHDRVLLRVFIDENDRCERKPLYEALVLKARDMKICGATVLRGPMGYGKSAVLHTSKILRLSTALPLVIEFVDTAEKIDAFLPVVDAMIGSGLVTTQPVKALHYDHAESGNAGA